MEETPNQSPEKDIETKKIFKKIKKNIPENNLKKNILKFFTDVSVVVIGIMLSLWFNDMISNYNQQKEVKSFLLGLKKDFERDILEIRDDMIGYVNQGKTFRYISSLKKGEIASRDSIRKNQEGLFNFVGLLTNDGRYEGFKSAGKLGNISDYELQNDIVNFYQEDLRSLLMSTNGYIETKQKFINYLNENRIRVTDSTSNIKEVVSRDNMVYLAQKLASTDEILERYENCVKKMQKIIDRIKETYKE